MFPQVLGYEQTHGTWCVSDVVHSLLNKLFIAFHDCISLCFQIHICSRVSRDA